MLNFVNFLYFTIPFIGANSHFLYRPQFDLDDLVGTTEHLLNTKVILPRQKDVSKPLARAYLDYEKNGQVLPNFHGLRDYYAFVKQLSLDEMSPNNIQMALARNFGGTGNDTNLCEKYFGDVLKAFNNHSSISSWFSFSRVETGKSINSNFSFSRFEIGKLINSNLDDPDARHLMVIGKSDSIVNLLTNQLRRRKLDPVVILGSQFPDDREDYSYGVLRRIMESVFSPK